MTANISPTADISSQPQDTQITTKSLYARQPQSPFLNLPAEVRNRIYQYLFVQNKELFIDQEADMIKSGKKS